MPDSPPLPTTFEQALAELEAIVTRMEAGDLALKASLEAYERGALLLKFCQTELRDAQQQVEILEKGVLKAFAPDAGDDGR